MREALFIKKNVEKWNRYQQEPPADPDETALRFTTILDDLSYARTFYPKSQATRWLNGLATTVYQDLYRNRKEKYSRFISFWKFELPLLFGKYHRIFLFTTIMFTVFVALGVFASMHEGNFVRGVLGDRYVDMTEDNIRRGDPFGVYTDENPFSMFVRIAFNNIRVAFFTFISGLTMGIITTKLLWDNGIMLGCFQYMFFTHGLGMESILVIWIHGTIEISSIIIAGVAGFIMANGILFPGTYTRLESFKRHARDAAKVLVALIPFFIIAAFLESYITHQMSDTYRSGGHGGLPVEISGIILLGSLYLIIGYFVIRPIRLRRRGYFLRKEGIIDRLNAVNA